MVSHLSCKSCCYQWEDLGNLAVKEKNSGKVYGKIFKDKPEALKNKFKDLIFTQPLVTVFLRMPYRIYTILRGDCMRVGYRKAVKEWQVQAQKWSLNPNQKISPPNRLGFCVRVGKHTFIELIKSITKVVTYPLAMIALEFTAIYGLINPNNGRAMYAALEHTWASNLLDEPKVFKLKRLKIGCLKITDFQFPGLKMRISDYLAICMQPKEVWEQLNLYKTWADYNPGTIRSLLRQVKETLKEKQEFYENEGINVKNLVSQLEQYQQNVRNVSFDDQNEVDGHYTKSSYKNVGTFNHVLDSLKTIVTQLERIERGREQEFVAQLGIWKENGNKTSKQQAVIQQECDALREAIVSLQSRFIKSKKSGE